MIENFAVGELGFGSSAEIHLKAEVMRRAFADRAHFLGDPDFAFVPVKGLTSKKYAASLSSAIDLERASSSHSVRQGNAAEYESVETTHYSIVDKERNAVAVTTTLNGLFGSGVTVAGFLLNNEMDDFSSKPGVPNSYGLIQGEANAIAPRKRPLSAMTPTIVKKDGVPMIITGSPGGPTIINTVFQVLLNVIDHKFSIQEAVDAPKIHHQWLPDEIMFERHALVRDVDNRFLPEPQSAENRTAYDVLRSTFGSANSIQLDHATETLYGAPDPRSPTSTAAGY